MNDKRFILEKVQIFECDTNVTRNATIIMDEDECVSYEELSDIIPVLNELDTKLKKFEKKSEKLKQDNEELNISIRLYDDDVTRLIEENKYFKERIKVISDELYCKDRKLEELGVNIECCDKDDLQKDKKGNINYPKPLRISGEPIVPREVEEYIENLEYKVQELMKENNCLRKCCDKR